MYISTWILESLSTLLPPVAWQGNSYSQRPPGRRRWRWRRQANSAAHCGLEQICAFQSAVTGRGFCPGERRSDRRLLWESQQPWLMTAEVSEGSIQAGALPVSQLLQPLWEGEGGGRARKRCLSASYRVFACFIIHKFVPNLHKAAISIAETLDATFPSLIQHLNVLSSKCYFLWERLGTGGVLLSGQKTSLSHLQWRRRTALVSVRKIEEHKGRSRVWFMKWQWKRHLNGLISAGWISVSGAQTFIGVSLVWRELGTNTQSWL